VELLVQICAVLRDIALDYAGGVHERLQLETPPLAAGRKAGLPKAGKAIC